MTNDKASIERRVMDKIRAQEKVSANDKDGLHQGKYIGAIQNSSLGRWCLLQGETIPVPKLGPMEERVMTYLVDKMLAAKPGADTSYIEDDLEWMVCKLYGLTDEERVAVTASQRGDLPALSEEEEDIAMVRAIKQGEAWEQDDEFLKHEEMMRKLLGWDEG